MSDKLSLLWFRDDPERLLATDLDWAIKRFENRMKIAPNTLEVPVEKLDEFEKIDFVVEELRLLKIVPNKTLGNQYFQLLYDPKEVRDGREQRL